MFLAQVKSKVSLMNLNQCRNDLGIYLPFENYQQGLCGLPVCLITNDMVYPIPVVGSCENCTTVLINELDIGEYYIGKTIHCILRTNPGVVVVNTISLDEALAIVEVNGIETIPGMNIKWPVGTPKMDEWEASVRRPSLPRTFTLPIGDGPFQEIPEVMEEDVVVSMTSSSPLAPVAAETVAQANDQVPTVNGNRDPLGIDTPNNSPKGPGTTTQMNPAIETVAVVAVPTASPKVTLIPEIEEIPNPSQTLKPNNDRSPSISWYLFFALL
jgi:hypothetical protein